MQPQEERHTKHPYSPSLVQCLLETRKLFLMPGMGITVYLYLRRNVMPPHLSQNGANINIYKPLKASKHPTMATQNNLMILQKVSPRVVRCVDDSILWDDDVTLSF